MDGIIKKQYHQVKNTPQGIHVELSVEDVPDGTYFIKLQTGNRIEVKKVIKN
jgi:hypothetical protein